MKTIKEIFLEEMGPDWPGFEHMSPFGPERYPNNSVGHWADCVFFWLENLLAEKGECYLEDPKDWMIKYNMRGGIVNPKTGETERHDISEPPQDLVDHIPDATKKVEQPAPSAVEELTNHTYTNYNATRDVNNLRKEIIEALRGFSGRSDLVACFFELADRLEGKE